MALPEDQIKSIKKQIIQQVDSWDKPDEQKNQAKQQIQSMNPQQLEEFLKKNNLIKDSGSEQANSGGQEQQCPFCLITQGKLETYKLGGNEQSLAILEIRPLSKGHTMVIPKQHSSVENIPIEAFDLALKVSKLLKQKLKPKDITISTANFTGHSVINIVPSFGDENGERKEASKEELTKLQNEILGQQTQQPQQQPSPQQTPQQVPSQQPTQPQQQPVQQSAQQQNPKQSETKKPQELPEAPRRVP